MTRAERFRELTRHYAALLHEQMRSRDRLTAAAARYEHDAGARPRSVRQIVDYHAKRLAFMEIEATDETR